MKQLFSIYTAELLKLKRTIALLLTILIPVLLAVLILIMVLDKHPENYNQEMFFSMMSSTFSIWSIIVLPMFLAIQTGLISASEKTIGQWKHIFCLPVPKWKILLTKWLVILTVTFAAHVLVVLFYLGTFPIIQLFVPQTAIVPFMDTLDFAWFVVMLCIGSIGLSSIHYVFSLFLPGLVGNIGLGISAVTLAMGFTWTGHYLQFFPWTMPLAALANFVDIEADFIPSTALLASLFTAILWLVPGIFSFSQKDIL